MSPTTASTFVLVHGAWTGSRCWREVADILRGKGHRVFTPTLTGLGERSHLLRPSVDLTTHVTDIGNVIAFEKLSDVVLVGHSYGGMVISGVAGRVPEGTIRSIVFLDAFVPRDGQSLADIVGEEAARLVYGEKDPVPPPVWIAGEDATLARCFATESTPHPRASKFERLASTAARERVPIKTFVLATRPASGFFAAHAEQLRADPKWRVEEIPCGHMTMLDLPEETAAILLRATG
jgi:pimeloyl-ACP methyl ester carboxylesterase